MKKILMAVAALSVLACTKHETQIVYQNPPSDVLKSFSTDCGKKNCVKLQKDSLDKTFILIVSGKTNEVTPQWMDLKPSAVVFQKTNAQVALFSLNLDTVYGAEDSRELLQSFNILDEDDSSVTFDWGQGFQTLRQEGAIEIEAKEPGTFRSSVRIMDSYIRSIAMDSKAIEILQVSKVQNTRFATRKDNPYDDKSDKSSTLDTTENTYNLNIQIFP
jgi:hypothetical protein